MRKIVALMVFVAALTVGCGQAKESDLVTPTTPELTTPVEPEVRVQTFTINGQTIEMYGMVAKYLNDAKSEMMVVLSNQKNLSCEDMLPALAQGESRFVFVIKNTDTSAALAATSYPYQQETSVVAYVEDIGQKFEFEPSDLNTVRLTQLADVIKGNAGFSKMANSVNADFNISICK